MGHELKDHIKKVYGNIATNAQGGCGCSNRSCCSASIESIGYRSDEINLLPIAAINAAAGCGNPTAIAGLKKEEVVLDLGSGGGIDVFLAAQKVGPTGKVIGVDMTDEMVNLARKNAKATGLTNVEFRRGEIENLPVADESVDVIISNCVINLSLDKDRVFKEAYRVLRPGGRLLVSDIVTEGDLPDEIKNDKDSWASCVAGAIDLNLYLEKLYNAGFKDAEELSRKGYGGIFSAEIQANKPQ